MSNSHSIATQCIHGGDIKDSLGSPNMPLYDTTIFKFDSTADLLAVVDGHKEGYFYTRYGTNPSIRALESRLAALDEAERSLAFCSGMAAISSLCLSYGVRGIICVGGLYGGTKELLSQQLSSLGITTYFVAVDDFAQLEILLKKKVGLLFFESPTNPTLTVIDIAAISALAHQYDVLVAVDNTFASTINQKPLKLGADFTVQSATKFLGGHSDLTAGVISGKKEDLQAVELWRKNLGQMIAPEIAHKLVRSLSTLPLRIQRHNNNASAVAHFLDKHPAVKRVYYPSLKNHPGHQIATRQMSGFGGLISFEINGNSETATKLVDSLRLFALAPSLGGVESLVTQPVTASHYGLSEQDLLKQGITGEMIRLSIGLEDVTDLIGDLEQAFDKLKR